MNSLLLTPTMIVLSWFAAKEQAAGSRPAQPSADRACSQEFGMLVCRHGPKPLTPTEKEEAKAEPQPAQPPGQLLLVLDIPRDTFARLAGDPELNRKYHPKRDFGYRPPPAAPDNAAKYQPLPTVNGPVWKYLPKQSSGYQPKQNWDYNRDVYGRIWRQNILHDTRVVALPANTPGATVVAVGEVR